MKNTFCAYNNGEQKRPSPGIELRQAESHAKALSEGQELLHPQCDLLWPLPSLGHLFCFGKREQVPPALNLSGSGRGEMELAAGIEWLWEVGPASLLRSFIIMALSSPCSTSVHFLT